MSKNTKRETVDPSASVTLNSILNTLESVKKITDNKEVYIKDIDVSYDTFVVEYTEIINKLIKYQGMPDDRIQKAVQASMLKMNNAYTEIMTARMKWLENRIDISTAHILGIEDRFNKQEISIISVFSIISALLSMVIMNVSLVEKVIEGAMTFRVLTLLNALYFSFAAAFVFLISCFKFTKHGFWITLGGIAGVFLITMILNFVLWCIPI